MIDTMLWVLLFAQIALGGFDTLYHHELTLRLAWQPGQATELGLHAVRNLIYAIVFLVLGWSEPQGGYAAALLALLLVELGITLWDFVEEDRTRLLPASERVTHTLLTLNYGVILALLLPDLWARTALPTALPILFHGLPSILFAIAALGVTLSGLRDLAAARRAPRLVEPDAAALAEALPTRCRILVTGGTGFVGRRLVAALAGAGHEVIVLTRDPARGATLPRPVRIVTSLDAIDRAERLDAIVNLAGESIAGGLWTCRRRAAIRASRIETTRALATLAHRLAVPPAVLVSASAIGVYGDRGEALLDETSPAGTGFCGEICAAWEAEADRMAAAGVRIVRLRIGLVLAAAGGLLGNLLLPFEFGMGGRIGSGRQWMSWIHRDDLVRLIAFAIATPTLEGAVNAAAPNPVRNADFTRALGHALGRPTVLPLPAAPLRALLGDFADELFLASQRVLPVRAVFEGFRFRHPRIEGALAAITGAVRPAAAATPSRPFAALRRLH
ncbi:hypothetical protein NX02_27875 [Sphingomonas sanxanigenens DSM 19645 = NX02]|uniref:NAD-dependent epimerase/dehydratase domain-containing protein n=2 Tax=Sphingomonas sanxanigenens TaxID=397260 RepID=W0ALH4_9SPHN|nr:hypothetical protein NX02_27875 [Sphingomonas sanxanigenens DSM 19645 = NX02]